jgi:RNA polymerase sigma-70 factor (ECF subfamily)
MPIRSLPYSTQLTGPEAMDRDRDLMRRVRASDASALDELLSVYWAPVVGYVTGMLASADHAEDVAQEAFIELWRRRAAWEERGPVRAYLYRTARNLALNEQRRQKVRVRWVERVRRQPMARAPATPGEVFEGRELDSAVERALASLPARRREVFVLVRYHGLTYRQTAEVMGISQQTVANQLTAALADLRHALEPYVSEAPPPTLRLLRRTGTGGAGTADPPAR